MSITSIQFNIQGPDNLLLALIKRLLNIAVYTKPLRVDKPCT